MVFKVFDKRLLFLGVFSYYVVFSLWGVKKFNGLKLKGVSLGVGRKYFWGCLVC